MAWSCGYLLLNVTLIYTPHTKVNFYLSVNKRGRPFMSFNAINAVILRPQPLVSKDNAACKPHLRYTRISEWIDIRYTWSNLVYRKCQINGEMPYTVADKVYLQPQTSRLYKSFVILSYTIEVPVSDFSLSCKWHHMFGCLEDNRSQLLGFLYACTYS